MTSHFNQFTISAQLIAQIGIAISKHICKSFNLHQKREFFKIIRLPSIQLVSDVLNDLLINSIEEKLVVTKKKTFSG